MRVISGIAKGVSFFSPRGTKTRPTSDFVKESLFNIIRDDVRGARFLDLFAGTGAIGIEALSRGASAVAFVDISQKCVDLVLRNLEKTRLGAAATVIKGDALLVLKKLEGQKYDVIFLDPPYFVDFVPFVVKVLHEICARDILEDSGYIILEMSKATVMPEIDGLDIFDVREYSGTRLVFMEKADV
jgi:16S rRNA (guanine(966)-N(2))-methyltransferase RsmD